VNLIFFPTFAQTIRPFVAGNKCTANDVNFKTVADFLFERRCADALISRTVLYHLPASDGDGSTRTSSPYLSEIPYYTDERVHGQHAPQI